MRDIYTVAREMRAAQNLYFKLRKKNDLLYAKRLEIEFDKILTVTAESDDLGEPYELNRRAAAEAIVSLAARLLASIGFTLGNRDVLILGVGPQLGEAPAAAVALAIAASRVGRWAGSHAAKPAGDGQDVAGAERPAAGAVGGESMTEAPVEDGDPDPAVEDGGPTREDIESPAVDERDAIAAGDGTTDPDTGQ